MPEAMAIDPDESRCTTSLRVDHPVPVVRAISPPSSVTVAAEPQRYASLGTTSAPAATVVPPVCVHCEESVSRPAPFLTTAIGPEMTPEYDASAARSTVSVTALSAV